MKPKEKLKAIISHKVITHLPHFLLTDFLSGIATRKSLRQVQFQQTLQSQRQLTASRLLSIEWFLHRNHPNSSQRNDCFLPIQTVYVSKELSFLLVFQTTSSVAHGLSGDINICFTSTSTSYKLTLTRYSLCLTNVKYQ